MGPMCNLFSLKCECFVNRTHNKNSVNVHPGNKMQFTFANCVERKCKNPQSLHNLPTFGKLVLKLSLSREHRVSYAKMIDGLINCKCEAFQVFLVSKLHLSSREKKSIFRHLTAEVQENIEGLKNK